MTLGYARIRADVTRDDWCRLSRTYLDPVTGKGNPCEPVAPGKVRPETCRNFHGPSQFRLDRLAGGAWQKVVETLNAGEPTALNYLNHYASGWRNTGAPWQMEGLSFAGNLVWVESQSRDGLKSYVAGFDVTKPVPHLDIPLSFLYYPSRIHVFTCVEPDGTTTLPSIGQPKHDAQLFILGVMMDSILGVTRQRYFETRNLEFFPPTDMIYKVTVGGLNVRAAPAGDLTGRILRPGEMIIPLEYRPRANAVWGRIGDSEWVALVHPGINDWYSTTWRMETNPPPS